MKAFFIIPNGHPVLCGELATSANLILQVRDYSGKADWYYDDCVEDGTEYGVKLEVRGLSPARWERLLADIVEYFEQRCDDTVVVERG